ncbi:permeases of the major facilitator superfamily [Stylonychia lemnae]|uniref:Permeases of the major facilitator superfamily n=1 Tax=Stylonychia lemnae TaxID=5949 RepID=A0A078B444_STYLE|nr:permeases of the major facilitator superfamily [Stylonychia lemnae]|eukprot:CDW89016.1 permeases of the major facilitator superfamily [Stylonychia lemnae]
MHSFYPLYIENNFPQLQSTHFGIILAIFEVANLVTSLVLGMYIGQVKRKNLIIFSYFILFLGTLAFTGLPLLRSEQYMTFFILSLAFRVVQGTASAAIQICAYSFATNEMNNEKETYIGYVEMALGVGDMIGPAIGSIIYDYSGFTGAFICFSGMVMVGIILSIVQIPNTLNKRSETRSVENESESDNLDAIEDQTDSQQSREYQDLRYIDFLTNIECLVLLLSACFSVVFTLYIDVILAVYIHSHYGIKQNLIGLFFFLPSIFYVIGAPLSAWLSRVIHKRYVVLISFILMVFQSFCEGPSQLFGMPNSIILIIVGVSILGLCLSMALVPLLSELIEILEGMDKYDPDQISDITSGLFNSMFNLGNLLAPLIAGILNDSHGYVYTCDFMMITAAIYCVFFYFTMIFGRKLT